MQEVSEVHVYHSLIPSALTGFAYPVRVPRETLCVYDGASRARETLRVHVGETDRFWDDKNIFKVDLNLKSCRDNIKPLVHFMVTMATLHINIYFHCTPFTLFVLRFARL